MSRLIFIFTISVLVLVSFDIYSQDTRPVADRGQRRFDSASILQRNKARLLRAREEEAARRAARQARQERRKRDGGERFNQREQSFQRTAADRRTAQRARETARRRRIVERKQAAVTSTPQSNKSSQATRGKREIDAVNEARIQRRVERLRQLEAERQQRNLERLERAKREQAQAQLEAEMRDTMERAQRTLEAIRRARELQGEIESSSPQ